MKGNHAIATVLVIILSLEVFHRNFLVFLSLKEGPLQCLYRGNTLLTPFTDYVLSQAASAITMIALGVAVVACVRADEFLLPARVLLGFAFGFSFPLTVMQAVAGYSHNCTGNLIYSLLINALVVTALMLLGLVDEREGASIADTIKKWRTITEDKRTPYTSIA